VREQSVAHASHAGMTLRSNAAETRRSFPAVRSNRFARPPRDATSSSRHRVIFSYSALIIHFPMCLQCTVKVCIQRIINANVNEHKPYKRREQCKGTRMKAATGFSLELCSVRGDSYALTFMQLSLMFLPSGMDSSLCSFRFSVLLPLRCIHSFIKPFYGRV